MNTVFLCRWGNQAASFDQLITYFAKYKKANMIKYQNAQHSNKAIS